MRIAGLKGWSLWVAGALAGAVVSASWAQVAVPVPPAPVPQPATPVPVTSVGGPPFIEAWVDPCNGNDLQAQIGCPDRPFQHINSAIQALVGWATPQNPGLVHINPGIYSQRTNGETFPIQMRDNIHLQGTGARQCVIRGHGVDEAPQSITVFLPTNSDAGCVCGSYADREVLVDVSWLWDPTEEEMIDGLTFQGGDIQVYSRNEAYTRARVSNCVFDLLDMDPTHGEDGTALTPGATFGILLVHDYHPGVPYFDDPLNILNNTFIQGWEVYEGITISSRTDSVAICDVNNPLCDLPPWQSDPNTLLRGVGNANIQNNLIRHPIGAARTALLGIDNSDVTVQIGTRTGPTNGFDPAAVGGTDVTGTYCSTILGAVPRPRVNTNPLAVGGRDPAFIGEMLSRAFAQPATVTRDWRLLPSSVCANLGSSPAGGILQAANGTAYMEPAAALVPLSSFDLDGEVYGNPRINGFDADIGFDETDLLVDCDGWANDSISHRMACVNSCSPGNGQLFRALVFPRPGTFTLIETRVTMPQAGPFPCNGFYLAYTTMPGTVVPPLVQGGFPAPNNLLWLMPPVTPGPSGTAAPFTYAAPSDPTVLSFAAASVLINTGPCSYHNEQAIFLPNGSSTSLLSNLQSSTE